MAFSLDQETRTHSHTRCCFRKLRRCSFLTVINSCFPSGQSKGARTSPHAIQTTLASTWQNSFCFHSNSAVTGRGARRRLRWAGGRWSGSVREKRSLHCDMLTTNSLSRPTVMRTFSKLHSVCTSLCERARRYTLMWKIISVGTAALSCCLVSG